MGAIQGYDVPIEVIEKLHTINSVNYNYKNDEIEFDINPLGRLFILGESVVEDIYRVHLVGQDVYVLYLTNDQIEIKILDIVDIINLIY